MKTVLLLIGFNLFTIYAQAQQEEYHQVSTQESYNLACKPNPDGSMSCIKINKTQEVKAQAGTVDSQHEVKEKKSDSQSQGILGGIVALLIVAAVIFGLFHETGSGMPRISSRC